MFQGSNILDQLKLILVATIFHELAHHLMKLVFSPQTTPAGCGIAAVNGESGALLEVKVIGGIVGVLWKTGEVAQMEKIVGLVLDYQGQSRTLSA